MNAKIEKGQRNRGATETVILDAVGKLVEEGGFENLGVNAVAAQAGVSKMLIYRYFESMDGLIAAYVRQYDFWINFDEEFPADEKLGDFVKQMFRNQIRNLRTNNTLRKFYRWELTSYNEHVKQLREQREKAGMQLVEAGARVTGKPITEIAGLVTIFSAAISYLSLLEENCDVYNGIPIQEEAGWKQIENTVNQMIDIYLN